MPDRVKLRLLTLFAPLTLAAPAAAAQSPQLLGTQQLAPRLQELTFKTSALAAHTYETTAPATTSGPTGTAG